MDNEQVLEIFIGRGMVDRYLAQDIESTMEATGKTMAETLADFEVLSGKDEIWPVIASELGAELIDLNHFNPPAELLAMVPAGMARLHGCLPVNVGPEGLHVVLCDPLNPQAAEDLRFALGKEIIVAVAPDHLVEEKINEFYVGSGSATEGLLDQIEVVTNADGTEDVASEANSAPIIRYVDLVMFQAIKEKASDIHFEPFDRDFKIRYRVDGGLFEMAPPPPHLAKAIISRVKVMSNMNIAETRVPQGGRIVKQIGDRQVDMRVSSLPTQHGESVVLRILDRSSVNLDMESVGLPSHIYQYMDETIHKPNGIFVVTGPTGAGKTTTLYAALRKINTTDAKLLTAEDPVEYDLPGISQTQINLRAGMTFARGLRAILRQDPDVILIGEIRDGETAEIATQASLTGHLVLSTLHTNTAAGAITRLQDLGVDSFLLASTVRGIVSQRLLRKLCTGCRVAVQPNEFNRNLLQLQSGEEIFQASGCTDCNNTGFKGRQALFELVAVDANLQTLIHENAGELELESAIRKTVPSIRDAGFELVRRGVTTIEEVLRVTSV